MQNTRFPNVLRRFCVHTEANFAVSFALLLVPMVCAVGVGIDYLRAFDTQSRMQGDLDAALIAAVKEVDNLNEDQLKVKVQDWFAAQTSLASSTYQLDNSVVNISKTDKSISASVATSVPTTFMNIMNITSVPVLATATVQGPATSYMNVYVVLDKSPSMLLAATSVDQTKLRADKNISCEFACHSTADPVYKYGTSTKLANSYYDYIKATYSASLRADVSVQAVQQVLSKIDSSNSTTTHIKVGLYSLGDDAKQILAPTSDTTKARSVLKDDANGLTAATSDTVSYFDKSLTTLNGFVGAAGDGTSSSKPLKIVLLLTDGVQSQREWVTTAVGWSGGKPYAKSGNMWYKVAPMNPSWYDKFKTNGATVGVLYTEYLPITADWGYNATVGDTMKNANWYSTWGGVMRSGVSNSITRHDYIPYALKDCATSEDLFLSASSSSDIETGLSNLFDQYLSSVRLTQ